MKRIILISLMIMFLATATAQTTETDNNSVETVLIASTANYPDTFISNPASEEIGAPILMTDKESLPESTSETLADLEAEEAILVGGPAVISEEVEDDIGSEVNSTTRLWGNTQIGTSIEVSEYFWSSSEEATVVQYPQNSEDGYKVLSRIAEDVEDHPLLVSTEGALSTSVLTEIDRLNASEVDVYSTNATNVTQDLEDIGVEEVDVEESDIDSLSEPGEKEQNASKMVVVAASGFRDAISSSPARGSSLIIDSEERISVAVEKVQNSSVETVHVTGQPELAGAIAERLREETEKEISLITGKPEEVAANFTSENQEEWSSEQRRRLPEWKENIGNAPGLQNSANKTLNKAEEVINENSSQRSRDLLEEARSEYNKEDYFEARKAALKAHSIARSERYRQMTDEERQDQIKEEKQSLREAANEMRELAQEQAEELREAETGEEKLEIIREFREERKEELKELREKQREKKQERVEEKRRDRKNRERFEQESGDMEDVGNSKISLELENSELKAETEYTGPTAGYTENVTLEKDGSMLNFRFKLSSPDGPAAQVVTDYELEKREEPDDGNYTVNVSLEVDEETVNSLERDVTVPGTFKYENEAGDEDEVEDENEEEKPEEVREDDEESDDENTVTYTEDGFQPQQITVEQGEDIEWVNEASGPMWIASDNHPSHTLYDGTSRGEHCENGESETFDQCSTGDSYEFEFEQAGEHGYHNHMNALHTGTVIVQEE